MYYLRKIEKKCFDNLNTFLTNNFEKSSKTEEEVINFIRFRLNHLEYKFNQWGACDSILKDFLILSNLAKRLNTNINN
jgi:hypothetical protein